MLTTNSHGRRELGQRQRGERLEVRTAAHLGVACYACYMLGYILGDSKFFGHLTSLSTRHNFTHRNGSPVYLSAMWVLVGTVSLT